MAKSKGKQRYIKSSKIINANESKFLLCEHWDSESGWKNHRNEQHFIEIYKAQVLLLVEREPHICKYLE